MLSLNVFSELKMLFIMYFVVVEVHFSNVEVFVEQKTIKNAFLKVFN